MKIKTSEMIGAQLDWAVAKCDGCEWLYEDLKGETPPGAAYSTDWALGGPIIERERISLRQWTNVPIVNAYMPTDNAPWSSDGKLPLIAAMRCYVASKLGDEVEVPEELT